MPLTIASLPFPANPLSEVCQQVKARLSVYTPPLRSSSNDGGALLCSKQSVVYVPPISTSKHAWFQKCSEECGQDAAMRSRFIESDVRPSYIWMSPVLREG